MVKTCGKNFKFTLISKFKVVLKFLRNMKIFIFTAFFVLQSTLSFSYIGPGIGGGIIAATIGIIVAIFAALFAILWFPLKKIYYRYFKYKKKKEEDYIQK